MREIKQQSDIKLFEFEELSKIITKEDISKQNNIKVKDYFLEILDTLKINIDDLTVKEFDKIIIDLMFLQTMPNNLVYNFTINGVEYGFHLEEKDQTVGEYSQLDTYINNKKEEEIINNLHYVLAIFCRPVIKKTKFNKNQIRPKFIIEKNIEKFNAKDVETRAKLFKENMTADIAYSIVVFFSLFEIEYMQHLIQSSIQKVVE